MSRDCLHCGSKSPDESHQCQWCGKSFDAAAEVLTVRPEPSQTQAAEPAGEKVSLNECPPEAKKDLPFEETYKSPLYIFRYALIKSLSFKLWLGIGLWAAFFFIPVLKISVWTSKLTIPIYLILDTGGVDISLMRSTLRYLFSVKPEQISFNVYLLYFIIWLSAIIIVAVFSGVCGYVKQVVDGNDFKLIKTFWQYLSQYYFKTLVLLGIFIAAGFFLPLGLIHVLGNSPVMSAVIAAWEVIVMLLLCYVLPVMINNDYGILKTLTCTAVFLKKYLFKAALLAIILGVFSIIFHSAAMFAINIFARRLMGESPLWVMFPGALLLVIAAYQLLVLTFSSFAFHSSHSKKN